MSENTKRYLTEFGWSTAAYVIAVLVTISLINNMPNSPWRIPLAIVPVIPVIFMLIAFLRFLSNIDELQQRIHLLAISSAAGITGIITFTYGFLENIGFPHLSSLWFLPMMIAIWGISTAFFSMRYK